MADLSMFSDAAWGFLGALGYASGKLSVCLWAGEEPARGAKRALCYATAVNHLVFGASASAAFTVTMHHFFGWAELRACAFVIGGVINEAWPLIKTHLIDRLTRAIDKKA